MAVLVSLVVIACIFAPLPWLIRWGRRQARGRAGAAMMVLGLAFGHLFDPARAEATETIQKRREQREEAGQDGA